MSIRAMNQYRINNNYGKINYGQDTPIESSLESQAHSNSGKDSYQNFFTISKQGKAMSIIDTLSKQKDKVIETKNELISQTLARGGSLTEIQTEIKSYDDEISKLDEKIAQEKIKELTEANKKKKEDSKTYTRPVRYSSLPTEDNPPITKQLSNIATQYGEHMGYYTKRF